MSVQDERTPLRVPLAQQAENNGICKEEFTSTIEFCDFGSTRYRHSFMSRLIQSDSSLKQSYSQIKNLLLSFEGVRARVSLGGESFKIARAHVAKLNVKGKSLAVCLALSPEQYSAEKYHFLDHSAHTPHLPMLLRVRSPRSLRYCTELICELMQSLGAVRNPSYAFVDYELPYESSEELIRRGLIKVIEAKMPHDDGKTADGGECAHLLRDLFVQEQKEQQSTVDETPDLIVLSDEDEEFTVEVDLEDTELMPDVTQDGVEVLSPYATPVQDHYAAAYYPPYTAYSPPYAPVYGSAYAQASYSAYAPHENSYGAFSPSPAPSPYLPDAVPVASTAPLQGIPHRQGTEQNPYTAPSVPTRAPQAPTSSGDSLCAALSAALNSSDVAARAALKQAERYDFDELLYDSQPQDE